MRVGPVSAVAAVLGVPDAAFRLVTLHHDPFKKVHAVPQRLDVRRQMRPLEPPVQPVA